mgnify:CR=1 FL=1
MLILTNSTIVSHIQYSNYLFFITSNNRTSATCTITAHRPLKAYIYNTYCINKIYSMPQIYISVPLCCMTLPSPVCHITAAPRTCTPDLMPTFTLPSIFTRLYIFLPLSHQIPQHRIPHQPSEAYGSVI